MRLGLERYQKSHPIPNAQYYWVLSIPIPNTNHRPPATHCGTVRARHRK